MFLSLLLVTFLIALSVSFLCALFFKNAIGSILKGIISDEIYTAWVRYLLFAIYVAGISGGVRVWDLEKYVSPASGSEGTQELITLNLERWVLELYRAVIGTLQGVAWMLLVFFAVALLAYVIVRLKAPAASASVPKD